MKSYIFTIQDEVCLKNGKDEAMIASLIMKLKEYGMVEDYNVHMTRRDEKWQTAVNEIKAENDKLRTVACRDEFEVAIVRTARASVDNAVSVVNVEKEKYRKELASNKEKLEALKANITAVLGE